MGAGTRHRQQFLREHQWCAFCGGDTRATTIEHCPPRALFQNRQWPEGFEFPACASCNHGTSDDDLLISLIGRMNPFAETGNQDGKQVGLFHSVDKQYPGFFEQMMPGAVEARRRNRGLGIVPRQGQTHQEAGAVKVPDELHEAVCSLGEKLGKGVFYNETGSAFPSDGCLLLHWFTNEQLFREGSYPAFDLLQHVEGKAPPTERAGKFLGDQFEYKLSLGSENTVFILQCRFGASFGFVEFGAVESGLLEARVEALREESGHNGPFAVLQSQTLQSVFEQTREDQARRKRWIYSTSLRWRSTIGGVPDFY